MDTPTIRSRVKTLQGQVEDYTTSRKSVLEKINLESYLQFPKVYILAGLLSLSFLFFLPPGYIYTEDDTEGRKLNYKRAFIVWAGITSFLCLGLFVYNYKKKENLSE